MKLSLVETMELEGGSTLTNILGVESKEKKEKKRTRKSKKMTEKEIMNECYNSYGTNISTYNHCFDTTEKKRKIYENYSYLSHNEKNDFEKKFTKPVNKNQEEYVNTLKNKNKKIIIVSGPAGTGKTLFAAEYGIKYFLMGNYEKLIFTRPSVAVDEELGFLPGTLEEKMSPYIRPMYDILHQFISPKEVQTMIEDKIIEIAPLGYMRGRTFKNCWIVADEMQNSTISQMKMLLTRVGTNSRLVITGDLEQFDILPEKRNCEENINGLEDFLNKFRGRRSSSIASFEFTNDDIQREDVVKEILEIYSRNDIPSSYLIEENIPDEIE